MAAQPLATKVAQRLARAAQSLGTPDPTPPLQGLLTRTFALPEGDPRYGNNALTPMAAPFFVAPPPRLAENTSCLAGQSRTPASGRPSSTTATLTHQVG